MKKIVTVNAVIVLLLLITIISGCAVITGEDAAPAGNNDQITELVIIDQSTGGGPIAEAGKRVHVHYTGWLYNDSAEDKKGNEFDSSLSRDKPFVFTLGKKQVIAGWDKGVAGMKVGGKRRLIIPSNMAYGRRGSGSSIPPNSVLLFDVELVEVGGQ
ncbi:MAG: FKBP-type peptidyl-prolyl cis-trans isomerase [Gammaproteobacteria bacterium]|nr:FKBP-type peptidyl-prolyl cis-trans isomerase [Gammaproteobacteria bacterium]